jgi:hypothetical protein
VPGFDYIDIFPPKFIKPKDMAGWLFIQFRFKFIWQYLTSEH